VSNERLDMGIVQRGGGALVEQETQRAIAEVQAAIILAKKFPRNQQEAVDRIINACQRPTLAEQALYTYSRGGSEITGPSIRMAEALAQNWGNLQFGIRELEQGSGESTVEAFAWDVETNTRQVKVFQVPHVRHTKQGQKKLEDPRDIYELVANQGARRLRACILGIIPGDVVDAAVSEVEKTMKAKADTSPEAIKKMVEAFDKYGVTKDMIEKRIQRRMDSIAPAQLVGLRKVYNSLKDGMSTPTDWFEVGEKEPLEQQVGLKPSAAANKPATEPKAKPQPKAKPEKDQNHSSNHVEKPEPVVEGPLTGPRLELHNLLGTICKGDEAAMGQYLAFAIKRKISAAQIGELNDEAALEALAKVREQQDIDASFASKEKE